ncbi:hypothetical protein NP233_g11555 [Leucocoprinus birnbaumii]|uniref:Arylamine N-acetyltransferase n=1 Tax=Leucocoprinus birnbaumii TaxID=56174 RepID=A0AAD5VJV2_9AGAR|nr:hypothetical protein NP233_g11555 [Leucocoprinus birnbaumii]
MFKSTNQLYPNNGTLRNGTWIRKLPSKFTSGQVSQYLSVIEYNPIYSAEDIAASAFPVNLETLERIMLLHHLTFPFENIQMHYTPEHDMQVIPRLLLPRFLEDKNGSYCFGHHGILLEVLRGLGFRPMIDNDEYSYGANNHTLLLVQPFENSNKTYVVDVGIGSGCLMRPLLLSADPNNMVYGLTETERHRLSFEPNPDSSLDTPDPSAGQWVLEVGHRKSIDAPETWKRLFAFPETECWITDTLYASYVVSKATDFQTVFNETVICVKVYTVDEGEGNLSLEKSERPLYRIILDGKQVKKSFGAKSEVMRTFESELDRIRALREIFGIKIRDEDEEYIKGREAALDVQST